MFPDDIRTAENASNTVVLLEYASGPNQLLRKLLDLQLFDGLFGPFAIASNWMILMKRFNKICAFLLY